MEGKVDGSRADVRCKRSGRMSRPVDDWLYAAYFDRQWRIKAGSRDYYSRISQD